MIGLYHFCVEYYKNKMAYLNIILIIKHRFYEKNTKTTAAEKCGGQYNKLSPTGARKGVNHEFTGNRNKKNRKSNFPVQ